MDSLMSRAATALKKDEVVAVPTETVYGLGALCNSDTAVQRIFALKGRPNYNPLIIHVENIHQARQYGELSNAAEILADTFWPGPLTLVVQRNPNANISNHVTTGLDTIAIRCPSHPVFQQLIREVGTPIAAPSANISGYVSPTKAEHVHAEFGDQVMILDGDQATIGLESSIVDCTVTPVKILRPGSISAHDISAALNINVSHQNTLEHGAIKAPGQLKHHYSPRASVRLNATHVESDEALLSFGHSQLKAHFEMNLSINASLQEAATNLFDFLRELDNLGHTKIAVTPIPNSGIGAAINERLSRAAAKVNNN